MGADRGRRDRRRRRWAGPWAASTAPSPSHARSAAQADAQGGLLLLIEREAEALEQPLAAVERTGAARRRRRARSRSLVAAAPVQADGDDEPAPKTARPAATDPVFQAAVRDQVEQMNEERCTPRATSAATAHTLRQARDERRSTGEGRRDPRPALGPVPAELREGGEDDPGGARMDALRTKGESMFVELLDKDQRAKYDALDEGDKFTARRGPPGF